MMISVSEADNEYWRLCIRLHFVLLMNHSPRVLIVLFETRNKSFRNLFWSSNSSTNYDASHPIA